jgi:hypothetical protein
MKVVMFSSRFTAAALCLGFVTLSPSIARACEGSLHIELQDEGVYAIDYSEVVAGQPTLADCRSDELMLSQAGHEVPIRIAGANAGHFAEGARIEWIGEPVRGSASWFNPFTSVNAYLLSARPGSHARLREANASAGATASLQRRVHLEQQMLLVRLDAGTMKPGDEPDVWTWAQLTHADKKPFVLDFDMPDLARAPANVSIALDFRGISSINPRAGERLKPIDHVLELSFNGKPLPALQWNGRDSMKKNLTLPTTLLREKGNKLEMRVPPRDRDAGAKEPIVDIVMFDWAELEYPIAGNLDASNAPLGAATANGSGTIDLRYTGGKDIAFYTSAGDYSPARPSRDGRYRLAMSAEHARVYPVIADNFRKPTSVRAVAKTDLRDAAPGYDYLIISHPSLIEAARPLAEFHEKRGLKVALIDVDDVFDQFNDGIAHPIGIRNLIAWGAEHWQVKPRYVLLVGTASFDLRHAADPTYNESQVADLRSGVGKVKRSDTDALDELTEEDGESGHRPDRNLIPTWQFPTLEGQAASDNAFVALKDGDYHPTIAIGRLPVVTPDEVAAIVKKTIDYATQPSPGAWRSRVMFISNEDDSFKRSSDQIADAVEREGFTPTKIYADAKEKDNLEHQASIVSDIDEGTLLVHFLGHGGRFIWRSGPPDLRKNHDLFTLDHVSSLRNANRLPMVLSMTCYSGSFDNPNSDTISERFLREPDKGAVAVFSASWRNAPSPSYSKLLVQELLKPGQAIGDAIIAAKAKQADRVLVETYNLFGDPALVLDRPRDTVQLARDVDRWSDGVLVRLPEGGFEKAITVNWLDEHGAVLQSRTLAASDRQFALQSPSRNAKSVTVYAEDARAERYAIGNLDLRPPVLPDPVKATAPAKEVAAAARPSPPKPMPTRPRTDLPDAIATFGFEDATQPAAPAAKGRVKVASGAGASP